MSIACGEGRFFHMDLDSANELRSIMFKGRRCDKFEPAPLTDADNMLDEE